MTSLPYLKAFQVSGPDAGGFLHAQVSADILALVDGQAGFAAYCSPRGQVIALLLVCRQGTGWFVIAEASLAEAVAGRLQKYILRSKVKIEARPEVQVAGLLADENSQAGVMSFKAGQLPLRYALTSSVPAAPDALLRWRHEEIMAGISWLQNSTSERFLPQMLGLDAIGAVSFSKGCYPGQEIIARTRYLGKLKRLPALLRLEGNPPLHPGEPCTLISDGIQAEGVIVDAVCPDGESTALRVVAPLEAERPIDAVGTDGMRWPACRILKATA